MLLNFDDTKKLLLEYGIPFAEADLIQSESEAISVAEKIGYPVALKIFGSQIFHKVDIGGVRTKINNQDELRKAFSSLSVIKNIDGMIVQKMEFGQQVFIGMKRDNQFGPVLMFGLGGIFVEVLKDISFRICPVSEKEALSMIKEIKGYKILEGVRGKQGVNIKELTEMIVRVSRLALKETNIKEIDFNPVLANEKEIKAVDFKFFIS
jgi:acetyl-CoA synthetase (ADP-forming)